MPEMPDMSKMGGGTATIQQYLRDIDFPVEKQDLIQHAREKNAPDEVVSVLEKVPDGQYSNPADVSDAVGRMM